MNKDEMKEAVNTTLLMKLISDVLMTTGVYPQSSSTWDEEKNAIKDTKPRTEWQEGWNACCGEISKRIFEVASKIRSNSISDELAMLLLSDSGWWNNDRFELNMNDTFYYACADVETVEESEVGEVANLFTLYGYNGLTYWVAKKRGYKPEIAKHKLAVEEIERLEDAKKASSS